MKEIILIVDGVEVPLKDAGPLNWNQDIKIKEEETWKL
jgi:hypothetical protein